MYGTIARLQFKPGKREEAKATFQNTQIPGLVVTYIYEADNNPDEAWLATVFESKEAYWANAKSPEQNDRYLQMMEWMAAEPEWHDGEVTEERNR